MSSHFASRPLMGMRIAWPSRAANARTPIGAFAPEPFCVRLELTLEWKNRIARERGVGSSNGPAPDGPLATIGIGADVYATRWFAVGVEVRTLVLVAPCLSRGELGALDSVSWLAMPHASSSAPPD